MMADGDNTASDYSDWMKSLPESLCSVPLNHLAIPGIDAVSWQYVQTAAHPFFLNHIYINLSVLIIVVALTNTTDLFLYCKEL